MSDLPKLPLDFALTTERLLIQRVRESDASDVNAAIKASAPQLQEFLPWATPVPELIDTHKFISEQLVKWHAGIDFGHTIRTLSDGKFIGTISLSWLTNSPSYELGYWLNTAYAGKRYMSEAALTLTRIAFETLSAQRVMLRANPLNTASNRIAEKLNFEKEGTLKKYEKLPNGTFQDMHVYAHTPESWQHFVDKAD